MPYRTSEIHIVYPWINIETKRIETTQKPHPNKTKRNNFESIFWYCYAKPRCTYEPEHWRICCMSLFCSVLFCFMCITNGKKIYIVFEVELCVCVCFPLTILFQLKICVPLIDILSSACFSWTFQKQSKCTLHVNMNSFVNVKYSGQYDDDE